jgi:hypothetical protein
MDFAFIVVMVSATDKVRNHIVSHQLPKLLLQFRSVLAEEVNNFEHGLW